MIAADVKREMARAGEVPPRSSSARFCPLGLQCSTMPYSSLAEFLEELSTRGELTRVGVEVNTALEIAEITRRVAMAGGSALLFDRPAGQATAVVTNLLGTESRACRALGVESLDELSERIESLIDRNTPHNWFERLKMTGDETGANKFRPKSVKSGPCQQVVRLGRDVDLAGLPMTKQWPAESAASITAGLLITPERGTETRGLTTCPLMALDENRLAIIDDGHSSFARHWSVFRAAGEKMPVAVVLGPGDRTSRAIADTSPGPGRGSPERNQPCALRTSRHRPPRAT